MPMERSPERREATQRRARVYGRELRPPRARPTFFDFREFEVEANAESVRSRARARELTWTSTTCRSLPPLGSH